MSILYDENDDPSLGDSMWDLSRRMDLLISYDPESDTVVIDRGKMPKVLAEGLLHRLEEGEWSWADDLEAIAKARVEDEADGW